MNSGGVAGSSWGQVSGGVANAFDDLPEIDLAYRIETPENVVLSYQVAGPATRLVAWLIDLALRIALVFAVQILLVPLGFFSQGFSLGTFLIVLFLVDWGYFAFFEGMFRGKTIGKRLLDLRVIHEEGYPLTVWGAILRNLVRAGDALPAYGFPCYGAGFVTMMLAGRFRRLGDLVARTVVIEERHVTVPREPIILERIQPLSRDEFSGYIPAARTMSLIEEFLSRRHVLAHRRGHEMALGLARVLARKLRYRGSQEQVEKYPMAFLARVYATFHRVQEEQLDSMGTPTVPADTTPAR